MFCRKRIPGAKYLHLVQHQNPLFMVFPKYITPEQKLLPLVAGKNTVPGLVLTCSLALGKSSLVIQLDNLQKNGYQRRNIYTWYNIKTYFFFFQNISQPEQELLPLVATKSTVPVLSLIYPSVL